MNIYDDYKTHDYYNQAYEDIEKEFYLDTNNILLCGGNKVERTYCKKLNSFELYKLSPDGYEIPVHISPLYKFDKHRVWTIDGIPTIITHIKENIAKGFILRSDFSLEPCYVAKAYGEYAHGRSIREARLALVDKNRYLLDYDYFEFIIKEFIDTFEKAKTYKVHIFFDWHNLLTGSCLMGREEFVEENGIDLDKEYTADEFIEICKDASYGYEIIRELKVRWDEK